VDGEVATPRLQPLSALTPGAARSLVGILTDIDDTLTLHGRIVPAAFYAMARAQAAGLAIVPVTGRPAGWCDHVARMWPCEGVVGENGGLWFFMRGGKLVRAFAQPAAVRRENAARLLAIREAVLREVPGCALASDQPYRELDLAVDFCEDVPPLPEADIDRIVDVFSRFGATAKVSSIHVNGWFGTFDKLSGFLGLCAALDLPSAADKWAYAGDSANDAPMFAHFSASVGVANVDRWLPRIPTPPAFRTEGEGGHGFAQLVDRILALRA
jgi:HAD superfamily hydrolase (TIGR01484 family)